MPWFAFFLWGIVLSRLDWRTRRTQWLLLAIGSVVYICITVYAATMQSVLAGVDEDLFYIFSDEPVPPMPFYMVAGMASSTAVISGCLLIEPTLKRLGVLGFLVAPGRQALTLYVAHIYVGMGVLQSLGYLESGRAEIAFFASLIFCTAAIILTNLWNVKFNRGLLESLMRKITG
ncbi:MAG TPA: DUF418 domain-containing protein [Hellea balneolensis]|uniref:DUF418 domain-containing protein n=1 Tax=Hellea balneolensis TaxID=287478 RepID=A0A7C5LTW4_9PROT|nr:DUF418 domain-containing protein [Hellea balneolensis]